MEAPLLYVQQKARHSQKQNSTGATNWSQLLRIHFALRHLYNLWAGWRGRYLLK